MMKSIFVVASLLLLLLSLTMADPKNVVKEAVDEKHTPVGQYQDIENVNDPYIQHLGKFAVAEHNNKTHSYLRFQKVIGGKYQVVTGTNYDLRLFAIDGHISRLYGAIVYVDLKKKRTLIDFFGISRN